MMQYAFLAVAVTGAIFFGAGAIRR